MQTAIEITNPEAVLKEAGVDPGLLIHPHDELYGRIEPEGDYVDNGIGRYEFWGQRCRDVRIEFECEDRGTEHIEWAQYDAPDFAELAKHEFWADARIANPAFEDDRDPGMVEVVATMVSFTAERETVHTRINGRTETVRYWRCHATWLWEARA